METVIFKIKKIVNVSEGTDNNDAVIKHQLDTAIQSTHRKDGVLDLKGY